MCGQRAVTCPACGMAASRVHSTYRRRLADRPVGCRRVVLRLTVRRLFCDNAACKRRTVTEQVEHLTTPYQRRTVAVARIVQAIGLAVGGRAGARLAGYPATAGEPGRDRAGSPPAAGPAIRAGHRPGDRRGALTPKGGHLFVSLCGKRQGS
ncbi:transposase family protein [Streptomyces sp. NPDC057430]|uniref:transposase family protein n=1 Tax=Streptomyces sp. NPDC057430 TaxID=3346131 RepID=UPI0036A1E680